MAHNNVTPMDKMEAEGTSTLGQAVSNAASQVRDKAAELGRMGASRIDDSRDAAASGLQRAASALECNADKANGLAQAAAGKLSSTANYVRDHDVNRMMSDVGRLVKNNPGPVLVTAVAVGFLLGRTLYNRGRDRTATTA